jgi:hypothetical protein
MSGPGQDLADTCPHRWERVGFEPRVLLEPSPIPWRRMRTHNLFWREALPLGDRFGGVPTRLLDVSTLCVRADDHGQPILRKEPQERLMPERCTLLASLARTAKPRSIDAPGVDPRRRSQRAKRSIAAERDCQQLDIGGTSTTTLQRKNGTSALWQVLENVQRGDHMDAILPAGSVRSATSRPGFGPAAWPLPLCDLG